LLTLLLRGWNILGRPKFFSSIPRVSQRDWGRVSKHVVKRETFPAGLIPDYEGHSDILCVLLHLLCYDCSVLPSPSPVNKSAGLD
jgi:hypothetical protein